MNEEIELYTQKIIDYFYSYLNSVKIKPRLSMRERAFYNHVKNLVTKIVNNNNQYILTDDIIWHITHDIMGTQETDRVLLSKLGEFIKMDENGVVNLYSKYIEYLVCSSNNLPFRFNLDYLDKYFELMEEGFKHIIIRTINIDKELNVMPVHTGKIYRNILFKCAVRFAIEKNPESFDIVVDNLFNNTQRLYERLLLNGVITRDNFITENFSKFIELELTNSIKESKIK